MAELDPRMWNLAVGVTLIASCGAPLPSGEGESSSEDSTDSGTSTGDGDGDTGDGDGDGDTGDGDGDMGDGDGDPGDGDGDPGDGDGDTGDGDGDGDSPCISDEDCYGINPGYPYTCVDNDCVPAWECIYPYDCPLFEECGGLYCTPRGEPPPDCELAQFSAPTIRNPGAAPLALSFVDVDEDGADELAIVTEAELLIYESGVDAPTASPREQPSAAPVRAAASSLDAEPGEDLTLLVGGEYHRYFSDGVAGLITPLVEPSPLADATHLLAGDFDGQAPGDLIVWGPGGALIDLSGSTVPLSAEPVTQAAAFEFGSPAAGLALLESDGFDASAGFWDLMGQSTLDLGYRLAVARLVAPGEDSFIVVEPHQSGVGEQAITWAALDVRDAINKSSKTEVLLANVSYDAIPTGDFDGDQADDIFVMPWSEGPVRVVLDVLGEPCVVPQGAVIDGAVSGFAVGDHDGDGDDEIALAFDNTDNVLIVALE